MFPPGHGRSLLGLPTSKHNPAADLVLKAEEEEERKKENKRKTEGGKEKERWCASVCLSQCVRVSVRVCV